MAPKPLKMSQKCQKKTKKNPKKNPKIFGKKMHKSPKKIFCPKWAKNEFFGEIVFLYKNKVQNFFSKNCV